jgi:DMSO/TMAO reductase YedYZ heme-binding membrane subunit
MPDPRFAKFVIFVNSLVPLSLLGWDAYQHQLGANPIEFALHTTGTLTLVFLLLTLTITPLRKLTGLNYFSHFRRMLGLYAFFYGATHLLIYVDFNQSFSIAAVVADTIKRPFILFGMTALLLLTPLAITSTNGMIKRLGAARWKRLHQLVYFAAIAGIVHYWLAVKADTRKPLAFAAALFTLLLLRVLIDRWNQFAKNSRALAAAATDSTR